MLRSSFTNKSKSTLEGTSINTAWRIDSFIIPRLTHDARLLIGGEDGKAIIDGKLVLGDWLFPYANITSWFTVLFFHFSYAHHFRPFFMFLHNAQKSSVRVFIGFFSFYLGMTSIQVNKPDTTLTSEKHKTICRYFISTIN